MKRIIRNFSVFLISLVGGAYLYRKRKREPLVRVLAFHNVVSTEWFERVLTLLKNEYAVISPSDFHAGNFRTDTINILLTFDDGYDTWIQVCLPILRAQGMKGVFFINTGLIERAGDVALTEYMESNLKLSPKVPLTWEGVATLKNEGHTIGGHTVNHQSLSSLPLDIMQTEITEDKALLEKRLGADLVDFAYPFGTAGDYSRETETAVRDAGYVYVYTAEPGFVNSLQTHIPRTLLEEGQPIEQVRRWVLGSYDLFYKIKSAIR